MTRAKSVVLPYISPAERLLLAIDAVVSASATGSFIELVADPTRWFGARGVSYVSYVNGGDEPPEGGVPLPEVGELPSNTPETLAVEVLHDAEGEVETVERPDGGTVVAGSISHLSPLPVRAGRSIANWVFLTHVHPETEKVPLFLAEVERVFGPIPPAGLAGGDFAPWAIRILQDKAERDRLAKCYTEIRADRNLTSLSLYSGPVRTARHVHGFVGIGYPGYPWHMLLDFPYHFRHFADDSRFGWLGTGDADLRSRRRRTNFLCHFRRALPHVLTMTLPHHGSNKNFHEELLVGGIPWFVASAGEVNRHSHPSGEVVDAVTAAGRRFVLTTERRQTSFSEGFAIED